MRGRLTDATIRRALTPAPDIVAPMDFAEEMGRSIAGVPQRPRLWWAVLVNFQRVARFGSTAIVILLLLALLIGILLVGSTRPRVGPNGWMLVATGDELLAIDADSGTSAALLSEPGIFQVTRSPDSKLVSFWTHHGDVDWLEVVPAEGGERRRVAAELDLQSGGCIDHWAPASTRVAVTAVDIANRAARILVADMDGRASYMTRPETRATCPIWSPDGAWLAYAGTFDGHRHVAIARPDGTEERDVSGDLDGADASGANAWSSDSRYVYFDAKRAGEGMGQGRIYRANVLRGRSELVFEPDRVGDAPQLSPDGAWLSFNAQGDHGVLDVWIASADGAGPRMLLSNAVSAGWSMDSQLVLAESHSSVDGPHGGLVVIRPDGSSRRTILPFESPCFPYQCLDGLSWGQPRP